MFDLGVRTVLQNGVASNISMQLVKEAVSKSYASFSVTKVKESDGHEIR